jgi:hypothetical protein
MIVRAGFDVKFSVLSKADSKMSPYRFYGNLTRFDMTWTGETPIPQQEIFGTNPSL